ncbi:MAG: helix-turn-helix domain-containing protein [Candidatus Aenigmarchaeota archaeon]|nr:helix-turn-helix domain-containing protein [Candidatus Aenigmarchaeota archaeon]
MRTYKFRIYPLKKQEVQMKEHLWIEKNLWNKLLEANKKRYDETKKFLTKSEMQIMVKNRFGEKGVYISFEESPEIVKTDMKLFGMDFDTLEAEKKVVFVKYDPYHIEDIFDIIESNVRLTGATRVCIDSISALGLYVRDIPELRRMIFNLGMTLRKLNCTSIITSEIPPGASGISRFGVEEFISDSVVVLYYFKTETTFTRAVTIWKMRATNHSKKIHPYEIGEKGVITYPQEEAVMKG